MIRIIREPLPDDLTAALTKYTAQITAADEPRRHAGTLWRNSTVRRTVHTRLAGTLRRMAVGREYCMYCGDNRGTDIDHFEPVARTPERTFDWLNHLLACSGCNSSVKRDQFPVDPAGRPLLIDPTAEDPFDHLTLAFTIGEYIPRTETGRVTIDVCGLNDDLLVRGRAHAFTALLRHLRDQPFADVCQAMLRHAHHRTAPLIFGLEATETLLRPDLRTALC